MKILSESLSDYLALAKRLAFTALDNVIKVYECDVSQVSTFLALRHCGGLNTEVLSGEVQHVSLFLRKNRNTLFMY